MNSKQACRILMIIFLVTIILALIAEFVISNWLVRSLLFSATAVTGIAALIVSIIGGMRERQERKGPPGHQKSSLLHPLLLWPLTGFVTISLATACPASEVKAQSAVNLPFKLMTGNEGECTLTPVNGGQTITMPLESIRVDKEKNLLITPAGTYSIIQSASGKIKLKGADGVMYEPNIAICWFIAGVIAVGVIIYAGCRTYQCIKPAISNYVNTINSNAAKPFPLKSSIPSANGKASTLTLPLLSNLNTNGAVHVMGAPRAIFQLPAGSSLQLSNMDDNTYGDNLINKGFTDIFGNPIVTQFLLEIDGANSFLVTSNGQWFSCPVQTSTDLINWSDTKQVVMGWLSLGGPIPGTFNAMTKSETTVTMTPDLQPYATNWIRFDTNGQAVESWTLARPPWQPGNSQGFVRLKVPTNFSIKSPP